MKKLTILATILVAATCAMNAQIKQDTYAYPERNGYKLTNDWIYSLYEDNYKDDTKPGADGFVRAATAKNGIFYFINRAADNSGAELVRVDVATGQKLEPIALTGEHLFEAQNEDGSWTLSALVPYNDIKIDAAGHLLVGSATTNRFQLYLVDETTGAATEIINEDLKANEAFADQGEFRFDAFGVYGDVTTGEAVVMAANQVENWFAFKWVISDGVAQPAQLIEFDFEGLTPSDSYLVKEDKGQIVVNATGNAIQFLILEADAESSLFYFDGNGTLATLFTESEGTATVLDDFKKNTAYGINVTNNEGDVCTLNTGHNGICEFQLGEDYFLLIAATNTVGTPNSAFALYQFKDANKALADVTPLWFFPTKGMGNGSNAPRTATPSVLVSEDGKSAKLCVYTCNSGYAVYTFAAPGAATGLESVVEDVKVEKVIRDGQVRIIRNGVEYNVLGAQVK